MKRSEIRKGMDVYHSVFTHYGKGIVQGVCSANLLESMFERGNYRVLVHFEAHEKPIRMQLREIRKTPNRKKIREMVALYQSSGIDAQDGGHILLIPKTKEPEA